MAPQTILDNELMTIEFNPDSLFRDPPKGNRCSRSSQEDR